MTTQELDELLGNLRIATDEVGRRSPASLTNNEA